MRKCLVLISVFIIWSFIVSFAQAQKIYHIKIDAAITPVIANFISYGIDLANKEKAKAFIIELDTPGGLVESTREIVKDILQSQVPVIVYVSPSGARAASAGTFILLSSHLAAMAPGTHVGAAHPVELTGKVEKEMMNKVVNDLVAWAKNLAKMRGRNEVFAEEAVRKSRSITEEEALKTGVIEIIAKDLRDLIEKADGKQVLIGEKKITLKLKEVPIETIKEDLKTKVLKILTNPNLVYLLLMLGLAGLYFELAHPGSIFPGVLGAICLILALVGLSIIPVNYAGLALILLAGILFFLELQVTTHGLLALAGVLCLFLGSLMLFGKNPPSLKVSTPFLYSVVIIFSVILGGITYIAVKILRKKPVSGKEGLVGKIGKTLEDVGPNRGKIFLEGEIWQAVSEEPISKGEKVIVIGQEGLVLKVKKEKRV